MNQYATIQIITFLFLLLLFGYCLLSIFSFKFLFCIQVSSGMFCILLKLFTQSPLKTLWLFVLSLMVFVLRKYFGIIVYFQCIFLFNIFIIFPVLIWYFVKYLSNIFACCFFGSLFAYNLCIRNISFTFDRGNLFIRHIRNLKPWLFNLFQSAIVFQFQTASLYCLVSNFVSWIVSYL